MDVPGTDRRSGSGGGRMGTSLGARRFGSDEAGLVMRCATSLGKRRTYFNESELIYPSAPPEMTWVQPSALSSVMTFVPTPMLSSTCESSPGAERIAVFGSDTVISPVCAAVGLTSAGCGTLIRGRESLQGRGLSPRCSCEHDAPNRHDNESACHVPNPSQGCCRRKSNAWPRVPFPMSRLAAGRRRPLG